VARAKRAVGREQGLAHKVQISHGVENLVLDEFVVVAQATRIENLVVIHHDGIVQAAAQRQTTRAHCFHVAREPKSACACDVAAVVAAAQIKLHALPGGIHCRVVKIDFETELEAVVRRKPGPLGLRTLALAHFHRTRHPDEAPGQFLQLDTGALQQKYERGRGAIENRNLFGGNVDIEVVQPQTRAGRHQVLHRVHLGGAYANG